MSKNNVRIAIRDSTDSHNVAFFDNKAGIKYKSANLQRFLAGSASILTLKYNSKDIDSIRSGCKLAFRYKNRDYWLNVMNFEKKGFEVELTAYSLGLELNNETRGEHKPSNAMSIAEYVAYYDPEHALTIGVNEVSDKRIKLEWTGTDTILARLFSVANSFGAELDFSVELNDDYSLKRQVLNIYKKGNLGTNKVSQPVRVGKELKVINYSDNIKELRTAVRATGKDGLTIDGLNKKIYDSNKQLLYYSSGMTVYAPQSRDRFPSVGKGSNDNWIVEDLGETQYETKEALWGYMYGEIQKKSLPEITYEVEGAIEAGIGDTQTLIDDIHFEPALYVQARVSELEDDILTGKVTKSTFINFERKYSQIADILLKQVEALAEDAAPYIIRLSTDNGYIFKNGEGSSTITARLEKYSKDIAATWKWVVDNKVVGTGDKLTVKAEQVTNTMAVTVIAYVNGNEVVRDYMTFSNSDDGVGVESIDRYFTSSDQSDGVTIEGAEWSDKPPAPTEDGKYLWAYDEITYTDGTVTTTKPAAVGANFDVDAFRAEIAEDLKDVPNREEFENKIAEELANSKAEIETQIETAKTQAESNAKEYADTINQETAEVAELANAAANEIKADLVNVKNNLTATSIVANSAQAAADAAKQELTEVNTKVDSAKEELTQAKQDLANVASDLNTAKQDLADSVSAVNTKVDSAKAELTQAKQQLTTVSDDLSKAKTDFQNAVSAVDTKATNLQSDLTQAKQDLISQAQQLQEQASAQSELTKRVSSVEKTANGTKTTVSELSKTVDQNGKDITSVTARTKVVEDDLSGTKTTLSQVKTTADSTSQKTATLESGLDGLTARFDNLKIGGTNLLLYSSDPWQAPSGYYQSSGAVRTEELLNGSVVYKTRSIWSRLAMNWGKHLIDKPDVKVGDEFTYSVYVRTDQESPIKARLFFRYSGQSSAEDMTGEKTITQEWQRFTKTFTVTQKMVSDSSKLGWVGFEQTSNSEDGKFVYYACNKLERGNVATDYSPNDADIEQKIAEYKQNADQNYASLQTTVQNLDGTVQQNKATAEQTAQGFKTRIESLETYKDGETTRANQYFESAKTETARQLTAERTAIAKDYVAKSTYTSDVTGIRNDLTATTTTANTIKTNLANYQASNDRAVANLQSNMQTANGNISSLKTKVEAVPGQITSAVSAVEGKIPTSVGSTNLLLYSADPSKAPSGYYDFTNAKKTNETYSGSVVYRVRGIWGGLRVNLGNLVDRGLLKVGDVLTYSVAMRAERNTPIQARLFVRYTNQSDADSPTGKIELVNLTADWQYVSVTFTVTAKMLAENTKVTYLGWELTSSTESGKYVYYACNKIERGNVATDWSSAPEDAIKEISNLSSEIKQTADGITLLATKTELSTAKNDLQSGINTATNKANSAQNKANSNAQTISTHTTQISALNTGLSAKVSQSDFNTLSGRVTTAENNITAKANELTSKITSVEGAIEDTQSDITKLSSEIKQTADGMTLLATKTELNTAKSDLQSGINTATSKANSAQNTANSAQSTANSNAQTISTHTTQISALNTGLSAKVSQSDFNTLSGRVTTAENNITAKANELTSKITSVEGAIEDTQSDITKLSSEIKQTADGMTLLATKTELNTAKSDLQSGINTATSKANSAQNTANSAQSTANSNAQTISTHTTQISALNTGLSAKVSQSDFNTLSGRVTTAENNITAKANELSSKITSVEGKIPTSIGSSNLLLYSADPSKAPSGYYDFTNAKKTNETYSGSVVYRVRGIWGGLRVNLGNLVDRGLLKVGDVLTYSVAMRAEKNTPIQARLFVRYTNQSDADSPTGKIETVNLTADWQYVSVTFTVTAKMLAANTKVTYLGWELTSSAEAGKYVYYACNKLERGNIATDYSPAPEDTVSQISSLSSEFKQTTDSIKASVSSLDNSTVKSSSLTINSDGIVMKAGKSTTDVANAIGSYFSVNQNAINLFSDKINVKGNMIVSGAITSDKIASKQINTAHLNGKIITADVISSNAVTADAIKAGAVTTDKMSANSINGDRITAGTLDAAKIKAGSITASQIASGTITSSQIKAGGISAANIAAGAITTDKIAAGAIDASKIAANAISANMITGGKLNSTNGATSFDLNAGTLTFNNNYGYIQRVAGDKIFEITTSLSKTSGSQERLTSAFNIRKSDNSRRAGVKFTLYNTVENKPTAEAEMNADALILYDSQNTRLFSVHGKSTFAGGVNFQGWGDIPIAKVHGGLVVNDIGIGSHTKSLLKIVEELCKKAGILWV